MMIIPTNPVPGLLDSRLLNLPLPITGRPYWEDLGQLSGGENPSHSHQMSLAQGL